MGNKKKKKLVQLQSTRLFQYFYQIQVIDDEQHNLCSDYQCHPDISVFGKLKEIEKQR